jgi:hypothetical protein
VEAKKNEFREKKMKIKIKCNDKVVKREMKNNKECALVSEKLCFGFENFESGNEK